VAIPSGRTQTRSTIRINKDRIAELFKAIHNKPGFIVDFDDVWPILNWSRKDNAVRKLEDGSMVGLFSTGTWNVLFTSQPKVL
jgi:hypothetical protein